MGKPEPTESVSAFYRGHHDAIASKREESPFWTRRFAYLAIQQKIADRIRPGALVLDAGCGEGSLAFRVEDRTRGVIGVDLSQPNVEAATRRARESGSSSVFCVADLTQLPFADGTFEVVTCSHVIEHVPDPDAALRELRRVTGGYAIIAMPTCLSPAAPFLLGGSTYWQPTRRTLVAPFLGLGKTLFALLRWTPGPQEGYGGRMDIPHVWRFPWRMISLIQEAGFTITTVEGGPFVLPFIGERSRSARWLQEKLTARSSRWPLRYLGYGTHLIVEP